MIAIKEQFNRAFAEYGKDRTVRAIFRDVYKDEFPEEPKHSSHITKSELQWIVDTFGKRLSAI